MSSLDERQLADAMHQHADDVHPVGDFLTNVRAGGQRRAKRRRLETIAGGCLSLAMIAGTVFTVVRSADQRRAHPAAEVQGLDDGTIKGDLAGDHAYVAAVISAWDNSHKTSSNASRGLFEDLQGRARVLWAGSTPAGPAAVVAQDAQLHKHDDISPEDAGPATLTGFVGVGRDGAPRVVGDTYPSDGLPMTAWWVDEAHSVLAAVTNGETVAYSSGWDYKLHGRVERNAWHVMSATGGVAIASIPEHAGIKVARMPIRDFKDLRDIAGEPGYDGSTDRRLPWTSNSRGGLLFPVGQPSAYGPPDQRGVRSALSKAFVPATDRLLEPVAFSVGYGWWFVYGKTPDGRELVMSEKVIDDDPGHVYAVLTGPAGTEVQVGAEINVDAALPVAVRLADAQGWVVASNEAALRYRLPGGQWVSAGENAALLPDAETIDVEVTKPGAAPVVLRLREFSGMLGVGGEVITD